MGIHVGGKRLKPAQQQRFLSIALKLWYSPFDQFGRSRDVPAGQRKADRVRDRAVLLMPDAGAPLHDRDRVWIGRVKLRLQHIGKEMMIAKPLAPVIQRDDKQQAALQGFQLRAAARLAGDRFAERAGQPVKDRRV